MTEIVMFILCLSSLIIPQTWENELFQTGYISQISPVTDNPDLVFCNAGQLVTDSYLNDNFSLPDQKV